VFERWVLREYPLDISEIISFSSAPDLSANLGQMSHLIT
jgi:hypothetical protein